MMRTTTAATLSTAALFWLSCLLTTIHAAKNLRASQSPSTYIRPQDRNLDNKIDDADPRIVNGWDAT